MIVCTLKVIAMWDVGHMSIISIEMRYAVMHTFMERYTIQCWARSFISNYTWYEDPHHRIISANDWKELKVAKLVVYGVSFDKLLTDPSSLSINSSTPHFF